MHKTMPSLNLSVYHSRDENEEEKSDNKRTIYDFFPITTFHLAYQSLLSVRGDKNDFLFNSKKMSPALCFRDFYLFIFI